MLPDVRRSVVVSQDLVVDVGEAEADACFELRRRAVELSVVYREYLEGFESCEPIR
jgi:hypothetical protein